MNRTFASLCALVPAVVATSSRAAAQVCYSNDSQCFSFAPPPTEIGNVVTGLTLRSERLTISGDFRLRVRAAYAPNDAPYNNANDQQATRTRVGLDYMVNEHTRMFAEFNFSETWAGSEPYSDARPENPFNGFSQAYFHTADLIGEGDTWRVGRSNYVLGNGLILGSCDFLQYPSTFTGIWASKEFSGHHVELFGFDNYGQLNLEDGTRFVGATAKFMVGEGETPVVESIDPFFMAGTGDGDQASDDSWYGINTGGTAPADIHWDVQYAQRNVDGGEDVGAYRVMLKKDLSGFLDRVSFTRTDSEGALHVNPADFNTAGLLHQYGGAWRRELETNQLGLSMAPGGGYDLDLNLLTFDGDGATGGEFEVDVTLGKALGNGVFGWIGYGRDDDDREVGYLQVTLFF